MKKAKQERDITRKSGERRPQENDIPRFIQVEKSQCADSADK
jgi:hypothetical protein